MSLSMEERLFAAVFSTGIGYADRGVERHGDYARRAFLDFNTLTLEIEMDCPAAMAEEILAEAQKIQARRGEDFVVSTVGQTMKLGSLLSSADAPRVRFRVPSDMPVRLREQHFCRWIEDAMACKASGFLLTALRNAEVKLGFRALDRLIAEAAFHRAGVAVVEALIDSRASLAAAIPSTKQMVAAHQNALNEALRWAAVADDVELMGVLVNQGASPAADNSMAMLWAAEKDAGKAVRWLIDHGANPRANCNEALRTAAQRGAADMVRVLLEAGAEPAQWKGRILQTIEKVRDAMQNESALAPGCG